MCFFCNLDKLVFQLDVNCDIGNFVYVVFQMLFGKVYMVGEYLSFRDWVVVWGWVIGVIIEYKEVMIDEMVVEIFDKVCGLEVVFMYLYLFDLGYDGGMELLIVEDI